MRRESRFSAARLLLVIADTFTIEPVGEERLKNESLPVSAAVPIGTEVWSVE
jgi:hypothetical protein